MDFISSYSPDIPVVSVGNLSFGGTGKTPMVRWLSQYFNNHDLKILILSRGYKGESEHGWGLIQAQNRLGYNPRRYGDEAVLLAKSLKKGHVVVGKERAKNLRYFLPRLKPDVVILDDGHQHLRLKRDINLVLFDANMDLGQYYTPPLGRLREGMSALRFADAILIGNVNFCTESKLSEIKSFLSKYVKIKTPIIGVKYILSGLYTLHGKRSLLIEDLKTELDDRLVVCFSGLASPEGFYRTIESLGARIIYKKSFPDHYNYGRQDLGAIIQMAKKNNALIITTEKDIVKLKCYYSEENIQYLGIELEFAWGEEELIQILEKSLPKNFMEH